MSSGLKLILLVATACFIALLEHGGPTMAIPISNENRDADQRILIVSCDEHIGLSYQVPCLDCELLTLLCYEIRQEHQPSEALTRNAPNPEDSHEFNEASTLLEYADHEDSVANHMPELGNEDSVNLLQGNFQGFQDHLQEEAQAHQDLSVQLVPQSQAELLDGQSDSITEDIEEQFYHETD